MDKSERCNPYMCIYTSYIGDVYDGEHTLCRFMDGNFNAFREYIIYTSSTIILPKKVQLNSILKMNIRQFLSI